MTSNKTNRKRFFILDGFALLYRAHFALIRNPFITSYGLHTSALFGFANQVMKLIRSENPDYIVCAFDSKEKTFRHDMYEKYKANRPPMPQELQEQLPHLWEILEAMNLPVLKKPGVEADDIIGTLALSADKDGLDTYIVSGDKDFMQLINNHIFMYAPGTRKSPEPIIYNPKKVKEKWGVTPEKMIDLLGLMGDSSDNVPGVAGVGEKTAVKLINAYGSLEGVLANADKVTNKRVNKGLNEGGKNARLSKELVTILTDVELACHVDDLIKKDMDLDACTEKFRELEFHALLKQLSTELGLEDKKPPPDMDKNYKTVLSNGDFVSLIKTLKGSTRFSFSLETTLVQPFEAEIVGIGISIKTDTGWYVPVKYFGKEKENFGDDDLNFILKYFKPVFEDDSISKTGQNVKYDALILKRYGIEIKGTIFDTMIAAHLLNPASRSYKLNTLSLEHLNYEMVSIEDLIGKGRNQITLDQVPLKQASDYGVENADLILQLTKLFEEKLKESKLNEFFNTVEMPLLPVLIKMEHNGVFVDPSYLSDMSNEIVKKLDALIVEIYRLSGTEFNINSTQQLAN
ncbi:MAG: 5'-3' exonuclease H3TH domain-containing protein, partial [Candidatus Neomarinimicrobiota bacterium]|nr:5'-3' exonuclease H3TH domain-containing protein [Candidatus Neomarinimicrobiota bacterium]